jgi:hypothetical protein
MKRAVLIPALLALAVLASEARAQAVHGCFDRTFPGVFLRRHNTQSVQRLQVQTLRALDTGQPMVHVRFWFRGDDRIWQASGPCKNDLSSMVCVLDDDAGRIVVAHEPNGARLKVQGALTLEADAGRGRAERATIEDPILKSIVLPASAQPQCKS